jgi:hypothetical protein
MTFDIDAKPESPWLPRFLAESGRIFVLRQSSPGSALLCIILDVVSCRL